MGVWLQLACVEGGCKRLKSAAVQSGLPAIALSASEGVMRVNRVHPFESDMETTLLAKDVPDGPLLEDKNCLTVSQVSPDVLAGKTGYALPESVTNSKNSLAHSASLGHLVPRQAGKVVAAACVATGLAAAAAMVLAAVGFGEPAVTCR